MKNEEIVGLVEKYFRAEWTKSADGKLWAFPDFTHRYDPDSSAILYSLLRFLKPTSCLEIGTYHGGTTGVIMAALLKNECPFSFIASEIDEECRHETSKNVFQVHGVSPTMIGDITKSLFVIPKNLNFLCIDTDHDRPTTEWIVQNIFPRCVPGALVAIHDFAVEEINGQWVGKGNGGVGGLPETEYYMELHRKGLWPLEKIYWSYKNPLWKGMSAGWESSFWSYKPL